MEEKPKRLSREDYQRLITFFVATRGTCDRLRTAATIWDEDGKMISCGYNGSLRKNIHCDDVGHLLADGHCIRTNHGEENAILNAENLRRFHGATVRIIGRPCYNCVRKLISVGVKKIEFIGDYQNAQGGEIIESLCKDNNVELIFTKEFDFTKILSQAIDFLQGPGGPLKNSPKILIISEDKLFSAVRNLSERS